MEEVMKRERNKVIKRIQWRILRRDRRRRNGSLRDKRKANQRRE
jgi:hypothetical protein